jgi:hypothetical protein
VSAIIVPAMRRRGLRRAFKSLNGRLTTLAQISAMPPASASATVDMDKTVRTA